MKDVAIRFLQFSQTLVTEDRRAQRRRVLDHLAFRNIYFRVQFFAHHVRRRIEAQDATRCCLRICLLVTT